MYINGKTQCFAVIGNPISHSLSPLMQNAFFQALDLNCVYVPLEVKKGQLEASIKGLHASGFQGINITIPYKEEVIPYLVGLSKEAELIGAVNTLIYKENGYWGENTDGQGLLNALALDRGWRPQGKKGVILGAGGSAKAVATTLALEGIQQLVIVNRNLDKAQNISQITQNKLGVTTYSCSWGDLGSKDYLKDADIIINTTPLGMEPKLNVMPPVVIKDFKQGQLIVDLIYNPLETQLLKEAKTQGAEVSNGLGMLINQGALSFKYWTGYEPDLTGIKEKLINYLG